MNLCKVLLTVGLTVLSTNALAENICENETYKVYKAAGYTISSSEMDVLRSDRASAFVKNAPKEVIINRILVQIQERANRGHSSKNSVSDQTLASEIYLAARSWGLDPLIFTKMIEQESQFHTAAFNPDAYDSGIAQTTYWAYREMAAQYSKKDVGAILYAQSDKYFNSMSPRVWVDWITRRRSVEQFNSVMSDELRYNFAYGLAAGASLLKIYLAEAGGEYRTALKMYNGAWSYADEVLARDANLKCGEAAQKADQILNEAAQMVEGIESTEAANSFLKEVKAPVGIEL